jgi:methionine synthase I (cobalamin-dependent)/5,10-methylenetetrahydrofolate reductase
MLKFLFDGAFGTYFFSKTTEYEFPEFANIYNKEMVISIHKEYIEAGVTAIRTNTFGANGWKISDFELCEKIIRTGYRLAIEASEFSGTTVFADIGPNDGENAQDDYLRVVDIFIEEGAKNFIFETQNNADQLEFAIKHIKKRVSDAYIIVSFRVGQDGFTQNGEYYLKLFKQATEFGADTVGINCLCGPSHMLELIKKIKPNEYSIIAMPNSGYPTVIGGRTVYSIDNPQYFAQKLFDIYSLGVNIIGGCCGTTPEHIKCISKMLENHILMTFQSPLNSTNEKSVLINNDFEKKFIAIEIDSPQTPDADYVIEAAKEAKMAGANFVTVPDSPLGKARANSFMIASIVQRYAQIPVIPHVCCRDKNNIAIKGDLIAANIDGVSRALAVTGDAFRENDKDENKGVFGFNSFKLISFIKSLNEVSFMENPYSVCGALNINASNFESEIKRAIKKIENGVDCLFTQPIFSDEHIENYKKAKEQLNCKIAVGIMPLAGYKNAMFLSNEVPGISIPDEIIEKLRNAKADEVKGICLSYSKQIIDKIDGDVDGFYIMTPLRKIDFSTELAKYILKEKKL